MVESLWSDVKQKHAEILSDLSAYEGTAQYGKYIECAHAINTDIYRDIVLSHIICLLLDDETLYVPTFLLELLGASHSTLIDSVTWDVSQSKQRITNTAYAEKETFKEKLVSHCFGSAGKDFIQEICAQDIVGGYSTAKKIYTILGNIATAVEFEALGVDECIRRLSEARAKGEFKEATIIRRRYEHEYSQRGALIYNRVFRHQYSGRHLSEKVTLSNLGHGMIDYRTEKNFCQSAVLHISVEATGSSGTGFLISEDGYALTCAHVVEGAEEVYANVIVNDGYPTEDAEGFEVYDVGYGKVVYTNKALDIAVLKTEYCGSHYLPLETKSLLPELGEEIVVFGYPLGYEMPQSNRFGPNISFYKGYVSSNQINNGNSTTFLDIDVKSGNSGSPVISTKTGKVIGIVSGIKLGGRAALTEKMPYMIPIQHFLELNK